MGRHIAILVAMNFSPISSIRLMVGRKGLVGLQQRGYDVGQPSPVGWDSD